MCGIYGFRESWAIARGLDPGQASRAMLQRLHWRGRDAAADLQHGAWRIGCARLAISGQRSRQPVAMRGGRWAGVLNGAITSAREVWSRLRPGVERRALPNDAWLPLVALAQDAPDELDCMTGHHAYAVVDAERDELHLGQDAAAEKPLLVVREDDRVVAFASTWPALAVLGLGPVLDDSWRRRFFSFGIGGAARGAAARGGEARLQVVESTPGPGRIPAVVGASSSQRLAGSLQRAVRRCADTREPLGLFLSGGIDSSLVAAELALAGGAAAAAVCYQFQAVGAPSRERDVARLVAGRCGLELRPVDGGPEVLDALPDLTEAHGLPLGDPSVLAVHAVARRAHADGIRVMLSGEGADELLLGYDRYRACAAAAKVPRVLVGALPAPRWAMGRIARSWRALVAADRYAALLAVTPPGLVAEVLVAGRPWARLPDDDATAGALDSVRRAQASDLDFYLRYDLLPKLDVATLFAGVEGRCPYLDRDFRAAAMALPVRPGEGKRRLARAYRQYLPRAVFAQPKRGFGLPLDRWFSQPSRWLDLLSEPRAQQRRHLRPGGLAKVIALHRRGRARLGHAIYLLLAYELWLRSQEEMPACA